MASSDWLLAARSLEVLEDDIYLVKRSSLPERKWVYLCPPGELPTLLFSSLVLPSDGHFPWGESVELD